MYVCNCMGIDKNTLEKLTKDGYTLNEIKERTGFGTGCGGCVNDVCDIYDNCSSSTMYDTKLDNS